MSSPVGHSLFGYLIYFFNTGTLKLTNFKRLILCVFIANTPDLDFIPGLILGRPNLYHHGISHSIGAAVLFSCILAFTFNYRRRENFWKTLWLSLILYCSHLLLDYISFYSRPPIGIPIFLPLSDAYYISPFPVLPPVTHSKLTHAETALFLKEVFSWHNFSVILLEAAVLIPFTFIIHLVRKKTRLVWNSNKHQCL
jgi:inner membrane protein